jgi:hypothetical protein
MADRKVYITVKVGLLVRVDEGVEVSNVMDEMDYDFTSTDDRADIEDMEILDYEITNSK